MARLPDANALGGLPSANSGRTVSTIDTSAIGKGQQALAKGINDLGQGVSSGIQSYADRTGGIEESRANSQYLIEKIKLDEERDNETDPAKLNSFGDRYKSLTEQFAGQISDPRRRESFVQRVGPQVEQSAVRARARGFDMTKDHELASADAEATELRTRGLSAKDEGTRAAVIQAYNDRVDRLKDAGYITDQDAVSRKQKWATNYAWDSFNLLPAGKRLEVSASADVGEKTKSAFEFFRSRGWTPAQAAGIVGNLGGESRFNTSARNPGDGADGSDSIGIAQWNADRATRLKAFAEQNGKPWTDFNTQLAFVDWELRNTHKDAGAALSAAQTPREAAAAVVTKFEKPKGSNISAENSHGWGNRLRQSEAVASQFGGMKIAEADGERMFKFMPPDLQAKAREQAERDFDRQQRDNDKALRAQSADVQRSITDDLASIESRGVELKDLNRDRVASVLGDEAANDWEAQRGRARKIYGALDGIDTLPEGEVEQRLRAIEPTPGSPGFVEDMRAYDKARKKADKFLEARRADPALAVDAFGPVRQARAAAEYEGDGERRSITPASAQAVVSARIAAQKQLGIQEPMAVTRSEARTIARQLRFIGDEDTKGMERFMRQLRGTYGDLADEVLTSSLQLENVNRDLAVLATDVVNKIAVGKMPGIAEARQFEIAAENQGLDSAISGKAPPPRTAPTTSDRLDTYNEGLRRQDALRSSAGNKKPGQQEAVTFDAEDIRWLDKNRTNAEAAFNFDSKYGPKASARILADLDRRKGVTK